MGPETEDFRRRLYEGYVTTHAGSEPAERAVPSLDRNIRRRLPRDRNIRILDIGCGQGYLLDVLREAGYPQVSGVDVSAEQVEIARLRGLDVTQGDVFDFLREHLGGFDAITAVDLIEHFDKADVLRLLDDVARALKPGGILVGQVPNGESPFGGRYIYGDFTHGTAFTQRSIAQVLHATGFTEVRSFPVEPAVHGLSSALRMVVWKVLATAYKTALVVETGVLSGHIVTQNLVFAGRTRR
ncbi:MAG: class I SAM-dependent methyltransferase [Actinomycetota bacterium]